MTASIKKIITDTPEEEKKKIRLYQNESLELMLERWAKLERDLKNKKSEFDVSKIPDVYDSIKYDAQHNSGRFSFRILIGRKQGPIKSLDSFKNLYKRSPCQFLMNFMKKRNYLQILLYHKNMGLLKELFCNSLPVEFSTSGHLFPVAKFL